MKKEKGWRYRKGRKMCSFSFHFLLAHMNSPTIQATESLLAKPWLARGQEAEEAADAANVAESGAAREGDAGLCPGLLHTCRSMK